MKYILIAVLFLAIGFVLGLKHNNKVPLSFDNNGYLTIPVDRRFIPISCDGGDIELRLIRTDPNTATLQYIKDDVLITKTYYPPTVIGFGCFNVLIKKDPTSNWLLVIHKKIE